jgi:hypothetical protein
MCCATDIHHGMQRWGLPGACFCGCDDPLFYRPRFMTKEQRISRLNQYLEDLKHEVKAVEEQVAQIKKEK